MTLLEGTLKTLADEATEYCKTQPREMAGFMWEKKFAELIIKDCIFIAEQTHKTPVGEMRCKNDEETVRLIKEHFGVK